MILNLHYFYTIIPLKRPQNPFIHKTISFIQTGFFDESSFIHQIIIIIGMKGQSSALANGKSMFSLNTNNTALPTQANAIHNYYRQIAKNDNYPYLSKIIFLQLVLRENVLIYSDHRVQIKETWNHINKKISQKVSNIYIIDQQSKMEDILNSKSQYKRVLLYDLTQISNQGLNYLLNQQETITLTVVQNMTKDIRSELTDIFPFIFCYHGEDQDIEIITKSPENIKELFQRDRFYECVTNNYSQTVQYKEEEGFLKTYLAILKDKITKHGLNIPHSRWKKMVKVLHFVGLTKTQGTFKRFNLSDCLFSSECLGRTSQQIEIINKLNEQTILLMLPFYGNHKFSKQLTSHFWIQPKRRQYFISLSDKLRGHVSFFYPCTKYPEVVKISYQKEQIFYRISGRDKKLMSDKYYQIDPTKKYKTSFKYRCSSHVIMHFGIACYDYNKNLIHPVQVNYRINQVCRHEDTAVTIQSVQHDKIIVLQQDWPCLKNWKDQNCFNYEKCIGFYNNGNVQKVLTLEEIIYNQEDSYSKEDGKGVYKQILDNGVLLTDLGSKLFKNLKNSAKGGLSKIMNHYQGGTYAIGHTQVGPFPQWRQIQIQYCGQSRQNSGKAFLKGTTYMRAVIMCNYNSGYPDFTIIDKNAAVQISSVQLSS